MNSLNFTEQDYKIFINVVIIVILLVLIWILYNYSQEGFSAEMPKSLTSLGKIQDTQFITMVPVDNTSINKSRADLSGFLTRTVQNENGTVKTRFDFQGNLEIMGGDIYNPIVPSQYYNLYVSDSSGKTLWLGNPVRDPSNFYTLTNTQNGDLRTLENVVLTLDHNNNSELTKSKIPVLIGQFSPCNCENN